MIKEIKPEDQQLSEQPEEFRLLEALAETLLTKRDEAVEFRASSGVERRWREDENMFDGLGEEGSARMIDYATGEASLRSEKGPKRSRVIVNIIRGKCEVAEGRFADIQLPTDDRNWGLKPTPVPEIAEALKDDRQAALVETGQPLTQQNGQPMKIADVAKSDLEIIKDRMTEMEAEIDDQLVECSFNGECRKAIRGSVRSGTGILKGPNVVKRLKKTWAKKEGATEYALQMEEDFQPASKQVDHWNVYPDPNCEENIEKAAYIWEREEVLPREVRNLLGVPGYTVFDNQIRQILDEDPKRTTITVQKGGTHKITRTAVEKGHAYEKWEYYGDLNKEDLLSLGCNCENVGQQESVSACVVFINDRPVKVQLNTLDSGELPYDFFQWTTVTDSPWGIGIPRMMMWQQRIITAAWRAMMDNAGDSSGANVIIGSGVEPDDGIWELTGKKIWRGTGEVEDVQKAFAQFQVTNNQEELQNIIDLALRFIDMETSLPMLFQGEKGEIPETLGATNIMVDANNVALRTRVKTWDDQITRPHIGRYYDWNMQYNKNNEIKGDYNVDARGTSVLLEKDQRAQSILEIMEIKQDPEMSDMVDWKKALKQLLVSRRLDILKSDEELKTQDEQPPEQPPQDPRVEGNIQVATIRAEGDLQKAELVQESDMSELEFKAQEAEIQRQHEREMAAIDFQVKQMEYAEKSGLSLEKIKADLTKEAAKINLQRELSGPTGKGEQVVTPVSEPAGRAPEGEAFQK